MSTKDRSTGLCLRRGVLGGGRPAISMSSKQGWSIGSGLAPNSYNGGSSRPPRSPVEFLHTRRTRRNPEKKEFSVPRSGNCPLL